MDDTTGSPTVVWTVRPITGPSWRFANDSLYPNNARSRPDHLAREFDTSPDLTSGPPGTTA